MKMTLSTPSISRGQDSFDNFNFISKVYILNFNRFIASSKVKRSEKLFLTTKKKQTFAIKN